MKQITKENGSEMSMHASSLEGRDSSSVCVDFTKQLIDTLGIRRSRDLSQLRVLEGKAR